MEAPTGGDAIVRLIADQLPVGIWVARVPGGELVYANSTFTEIMGMGARADVVVGGYAKPYNIFRTDGALYPEEELPFVRAAKTRSVALVDDIVIHRHDGRKVNIRAQARPLFDATGELAMIAIAFIDITREATAEAGRVESEARLRHALKMDSIGNLAGGIAHDFNNMLGAAQVLAQMLRRVEMDAAGRSYVEQLEQVIGSATQLTRSLLSFARRSPTVATPFAMNEVVRRVAALIERTFDKSIEVALELDPEGAPVLGDPSQIEQVLMNLVMNARDAMPGGGRLLIGTRRREEQIVLTVSDNGSGIPRAVRERIFEPYFTTKPNTRNSGTGIGLAVAYGIVQTHGGTIEVADAEPRGTSMRVILPRATSAVPAAEANGARAPAEATGRGTVLLVDDERLVLDATSRALRVLGYDVLQAATGAQAISLFRERRAEIRGVILDLMMPDMDGAGTLAKLVAIDPKVRVVVATGGTISAEMDGSFSCAAGFLSKPYDLESLGRAAAHLTGGHEGVLRL